MTFDNLNIASYALSFTAEAIEFKKPLSDVRVSKLGDSARFDVDVGRERTRAQWLKDGLGIVHDGKKYDIGASGTRHHLTVNGIDERDGGDYAVLVKGHRSVPSNFLARGATNACL